MLGDRTDIETDLMINTGEARFGYRLALCIVLIGACYIYAVGAF